MNSKRFYLCRVCWPSCQKWLRLFALLAIASCSVSCQKPHKSSPAAVAEGEVWLTAEQAEAAQIQTAEVRVQDVDDTILIGGRVVFDDTRVTHVFSPVSGRVKEILVDLGQRVKKGDALAVIESPDVGIASSDLGKAQAELMTSEHELRRQRELFLAHAASEREYEQAQDNYRKARSEQERARQKTRLFHTSSSDSVTQTYTVHSEIDGEVILRGINPGMEVFGQYSGGTPIELFTIGNLDRIWVFGDLYELDLPRVKSGVPAEVKSMALPQRVFSGQVNWVSGALDATTRTARVRCLLDNADHALRPEMFVTVRLTVDAHKALAVPRAALLRIGDRMMVFVKRGLALDGRLRFAYRPVQVDAGENGRLVQVEHGLEPGATIVTAGAILLAGML